MLLPFANDTLSNRRTHPPSSSILPYPSLLLPFSPPSPLAIAKCIANERRVERREEEEELLLAAEG